MPRPNQGPRLVLYGPDNRHGATPRRGFKTYVWYVVWSERGTKRERSTGTEDRLDAREILRQVEDEVTDSLGAPPVARARPSHQILIGDVLAIYGEKQGKRVKARVRLGVAIIKLSDFWADRTVAEVNQDSIDKYIEKRLADFAESERARVASAKAKGKQPKPPRTLSISTVRRELVTLRAALRHAYFTHALKDVPPMRLPAETEPRDRYLTRNQIAKLVRAARSLPRARYLALFVLIAFYTGARMRAILRLRWESHSEGGGWVDLERGTINFLGNDTQTKKRRIRMAIPSRLKVLLQLARLRTNTHVLEYNGRPIDDVKTAMARAARAAGIGGMTTHTLKHSAISHLLALGVPIWTVSRLTGTSVATIEKTYGHMDPERTVEARHVRK